MPSRIILTVLVLSVACFPTTKDDTSTGPCGHLLNGGAELGELAGWTAEPEVAIQAVQSQDQTDGTVTPDEGDWFFSFAIDPADSASLVWNCAPAPEAVTCTLEGAVQTEGLGDPPDIGMASLAFLDDAGVPLASESSDDLSTDSLSWEHFSLSLDLAEGAAEVRVELTGTRSHGDYVNVFWDDLALICFDGSSSASKSASSPPVDPPTGRESAASAPAG